MWWDEVVFKCSGRPPIRSPKRSLQSVNWSGSQSSFPTGTGPKPAVIAREWKYLDPVRSYCEARGIPVQSADADAPGFWRLKETQTLVDWLRGRESNVVKPSELTEWMSEQSVGSWWSVLREGVEDFIEELGDRETDRKDVLEWLAEWGHQVRRRQTGLLLLSAHRAKGLEFDDVVVLDGGWERRSKTEDSGRESPTVLRCNDESPQKSWAMRNRRSPSLH